MAGRKRGEEGGGRGGKREGGGAGRRAKRVGEAEGAGEGREGRGKKKKRGILALKTSIFSVARRKKIGSKTASKTPLCLCTGGSIGGFY